MSAGLLLALPGKASRLACALVLVGAAGCLGSAPAGGGGGNHGGGTGGNGTSDGSASAIGDGGAGPSTPPDLAPDVVGLFYANVAPVINAACAGCHGVAGGAGPAFM